MFRRRVWQGAVCALLIVCIVWSLAFSPTAAAVSLTTASLGTLLMLGLSSIGVNLNWSESTTGEILTNKVVDDFSTFLSNSAKNISEFVSGVKLLPDKKIVFSSDAIGTLSSFVQYFIGNGSIAEGSTTQITSQSIDGFPYHTNYQYLDGNFFIDRNHVSIYNMSNPYIHTFSNGQYFEFAIDGSNTSGFMRYRFRSTGNYRSDNYTQPIWGVYFVYNPTNGNVGLGWVTKPSESSTIYNWRYFSSAFDFDKAVSVNSSVLFGNVLGIVDQSSIAVSVPNDFVESLPALGSTDYELSDGTTVSLPDEYVVTLPESFPGLGDLTGLDDLGTVSLPDIVADGTTSDLEIESEVVEAEVPVEPPVDTDWNFEDIGELFTTRFPFSIPWDVGAALTAISAEPVEPDFSVNIFSGVDSIEDDTEIETKISDIPGIDVIHEILRWGSIALFAVGLAVATKHLIWTS